MRALRAAICAALFVSIAGKAAHSQTTGSGVIGPAPEVTLSSTDGAISLTGTLLGYDGEFYRLETAYGVLTLDGSRVACRGAACPPPGPQPSRFTLAGAGVLAETLLPALIEDFAARAGYTFAQTQAQTQAKTGVRLFRLKDATDTEVAEITLRASTSTDGFVDLVTDQADMALALREVTGHERAIAIDAGLGDLLGPRQYRVLARDALVPVFNATNPLDSMTLPALAQVFAGDVANWSDLGGGDAPITLHLTDPTSGIGAAFVERVMTPSDKALSPAIAIHPDATALAQALADDPNGIGITLLTRAGGLRVPALTGACGLDLRAGAMAVKAADYPLTLPLYLYLPGRRLPAVARAFLTYLRGPEAQAIVRAAGFVDQTFAEIPLSAQGARLAGAIRAAGPEVSLGDLQRMMPLFTGSQRLSLTFRFLDGTTELDPPSRANIATLAAALEAGAFDGRRLTFAGFSDSAGSAAANLTLSQRRAETARAAVLAWASTFDPDKVTIETDGFGEALPMACDDTPWGRQVNRRVELWVQ